MSVRQLPSIPGALPIALALLIEHRAAGQTCSPAWSPLGSGVTALSSATVSALAVLDDGSGPSLFAGGNFADAGNTPAVNIAAWDGTQWRPLGFGLGFTVTALAVFGYLGSGPHLYAPGFVWSGSSWVELPVFPATGGNSSAPCLLVWDDGSGLALYEGGGFSGNGYNGLAKWNGSSWSPVGNGVTSSGTHGAGVQSMVVFDDGRGPALYVGGFFEFAGGGAVPAVGIARWDGTSWTGVGGGLYNNPVSLPEVHAMGVFGGWLYVSGYITAAGGIPTGGIARWNGTTWQGNFGATFSNDNAYSMAVFDDGSGPALWMTGVGNGVLSHGLAKWDGASWSTPAPGGISGGGLPGPTGNALAVYDAGSGPGLYVGGHFTIAGTTPVNNIARFGRPACFVNCDGSFNAGGCPTLAVNDFTCFLNRFAAHDQRANCDGSSNAPTLNVLDFLCYLNRFAAGCS